MSESLVEQDNNVNIGLLIPSQERFCMCFVDVYSALLHTLEGAILEIDKHIVFFPSVPHLRAHIDSKYVSMTTNCKVLQLQL